MDFRTSEGKERYAALVADAVDVVVGLDFDGTLSPIVDDPAQAFVQPDAPRVLTDLAAQVRAVVVVTGRPAAQVVGLGRLDEVADALLEDDRLVVMGQYGNERWDADRREVTSPPPPEGLQAFRDELPRILAREGARDAFVEDKGIALAVHTRRLPDPKEAFARLEEELTDAAERHGLAVEPGRLVIEVRAPGMHKGLAVRAAVEEHDAGGVVFCGDDLGDLEAFEAVRELADTGLPGLLVCSGSEEQQALAERADLVVDGPAGVLRFLASYAADAEAHAV
ncbi:MAG: trehalose-phosphatase [Nocardioidaceae bacterium]|nr:trehalose-phosphatase [Nocardioidaceae bacterium]NUS52567.1 trehalose-phosphatase [Nocardioidaceae bacterium]